MKLRLNICVLFPNHSVKLLKSIMTGNPTTGQIPRENPNWKRYMYPGVHSSTFYISQDTEAT